MYKTETDGYKMEDMQFNLLCSKVKRTIETCNYNRHISDTHPDRVMNHHDLIYIRSGSWSISQDGHDYEVTAGDIILLQRGHHHYGLAPSPGTVETCFVHFSGTPDDLLTDGEPSETPDHYCFPMIVHCADAPKVEQYFRSLIQAYWAEEPYLRCKAPAYLDLCLCEISNRWQRGAESSPLVEAIQAEIRKTPGRFITNRELAEKYRYSERTLSAQFRRSTGCSLHAWQLRLKCQMADELLRSDPTLTLKEVAAVYGFYDEYHFGKCYKKQFGRSPKRGK